MKFSVVFKQRTELLVGGGGGGGLLDNQANHTAPP